MSGKITVGSVREMGRKIVSIVGLATHPVGVRFLRGYEENGDDPGEPQSLRYCQALMKARRREKVLINADTITCPAAASVFGFKQLPEGLRSGKGLVGFGIVKDEAVGKRMFERMPRLKLDSIAGLSLYPLVEADEIPDVIVVEDEVERLMWIVLGYLHAKGGDRVLSSTAVLQATCVDSTITPYLDQRLNLSYGCYGCRDATDIGSGEAVLGFPVSDLPAIVEHLTFLAQKAIPASRGKNALAALRGREGNNTDCTAL
ncbi:MAG: DUF169 domain-containing protein [Proteobacteria bacterium]|nr:DUF169 domain-containing protein [Pseudomonadota bacterium]